MEFINDECSDTQNSDVLVPSSQRLSSPEKGRPAKRRRLTNSSSDSAEYDLPSNEGLEEDDFDNPRSKYDPLIHIPAFAESQKNEFVSQVEQPWSSPTAIRGPRWRKKSPTPPSKLASPIRPPPQRLIQPSSIRVVQQAKSSKPIVVDEYDDEDMELIDALIASEKDQTPVDLQTRMTQVQQAARPMRQTTLFGMHTTQREAPVASQGRTHSWPMAARNEPPTHHKIDTAAMQTWTYPLNVGTIRDYQYNIVHRALFHNLLVALPTGLGKTFIAATVMLNYFNWTKDAQIVFVAPTKPLVSQQINACFNIAGIPRSQTTLLTGEIQPAIRAEEWQEKRVFFMTPQTLINDLKTGMANPKKIVLLVVDEAHKATGNYAYVEVVRFLRRFNSSFRVLALTATPGATVEAVQKVIDGLDIARVEIRTEESMDIRNFVHKRNEEVQLFDNSEEIEMCLDLFATAVRPVLTKVNSLNAYFSNDPKTMTLYGLMKGREQWTKSDAGRKADWGLKGMMQSCFKPLMSLAHNLELLKYHGIGPFYHKMKTFNDEAYGLGKNSKQIVENESYKKLMTRLKAWVNEENFVGHPKLTYLNEVVLNHFMDAGSGLGAAGDRPPSNTRIMVFAHYRDSAEEIVRVLNRHQPMVRAHVFVGQSGTKGSEGMDQKTQISIIEKFKSGIYNTLVATSIGEEGLDIGEVDLIVCYDCSKSPIRMLQRMGRTGRKRAGNIVLLLMRGKEERDYHAAKDNYLKMQGIIESGKEFQFHDDASPRIIPREIQPLVDKRHIDIPVENTQAESLEPRKRKSKNAKRPPKKFHMPDDVETGFHFLGKKKKTVSTAKDKSVTKHVLDNQEASLPMIQSVWLSEKDEKDLHRRYAQVAGNQTQYVQTVRLEAFPNAIHRAGKTSIVKHSKATTALLNASKAMRDNRRSWNRPECPTATRMTSSNPHKLTKKAYPICKNTSVHASGTTEENESEDERVYKDITFSATTTRVLPHTSGNLRHARTDSEKDKNGSDASVQIQESALQISTSESDSDLEDLPSLDDLLVAKAQPRSQRNQIRYVPGSHSSKQMQGKQRSRRVISDDSDG